VLNEARVVEGTGGASVAVPTEPASVALPTAAWSVLVLWVETVVWVL